MVDREPLSTLLSQVLIAFTIELDNEAEQRRIAGSVRVWPTSLVMWSNFMRFVGEDGLRIGDLPARAGVPGTPVKSSWIHAAVTGMTRWRYVDVIRDPADTRPKPPRADWLVRPTPAGRKAQQVWAPLGAEIEARWRARFGDARVAALREALGGVRDTVEVVLPHYLPVVTYADGMRTAAPQLADPGSADVPPDRGDTLDLSALLAQVLLLLAVEFERASSVSLAIGANALRVLPDDGARVGDLPARAGVSKEAVSASLTFLERRGLVAVVPDPNASRGKVAVPTPDGRAARDTSAQLLGDVDTAWRARFGAATVDRLRDALDALLADGRFPEGMVPPPGGWRARKPYATASAAIVADPRHALPHHPMVLHRGGWPDGS